MTGEIVHEVYHQCFGIEINANAFTCDDLYQFYWKENVTRCITKINEDFYVSLILKEIKF